MIAAGELALCSVNGDAFIDGASLMAVDGGIIEAATVRSYSHGSTANNQVHGFTARGEGSRITLANLETIIGGTHDGSDVLIEASGGGSIEMPVVRQMLDVSSGDLGDRAFLVRALDADRAVYLPSLMSIVDTNGSSKTGWGEYSRLTAVRGGTIFAPPYRRRLESSAILTLPQY